MVGDISPAVFSTSGYTGVVNMYFVANCSAVTAPSWGGCRNSMSGSEAIAVDAKMDDGIGTTGFVVGARLSSLVTAGAFLSSWVTTAAETAYVPGNTVNTTTGNILVIRLGRKTGEVRK